MALFKALSHRPFALVWSGQTLSRLGDSLYQIALIWWVVETTGSAEAMSVVFICAFIPTILLALFGGAVVDRRPRARIMFSADVARAILTSTMAALAVTQALALWHVYVASILFGAINTFFLPAYAALIPDVTPSELLPSANALTSLNVEIGGIIGPTAAALIVGAGGLPLAFALNGLSFVASALCMLPLLQLRSTQPPYRPNVLSDIRDGLAGVTQSSWLLYTVLLLALINLTGRSPMTVSLPFLVSDSLNSPVLSLGVLYSLFSLGSIAGALVLGRLPRLRRRGLIVYVGLILVGLVTVGIGLADSIVGVAPCIVLLGLAISISNLTWTNLLQDKIAPGHLGRVSSINLVGSTSLLPIGLALAGSVTDVWGAPTAFIIGGALTTCVAGVGLTLRSIRRLD